MTKELPKHIQDAMNNADVPKDMVAMPYLTPTPKDNIKEEAIGGDLFRISMDNSYAVVSVSKKGENISISFQDNKLESQYYLAKINGYVLCEIAPRLGVSIKKQK